MNYLHDSKLGKHGWLTSFDCVVDNKWLLKLTNFGYAQIHQQSNYVDFRQNIDILLWSAPEIIRACQMDNEHFWGSKEGDVYSFAIIMSEIISNKAPFSIDDPLSNQEIINRIKKGAIIRPSMCIDFEIPDQIMDLMTKCWSENYQLRPKMKQVYDILNKQSDGR